MKTLANSTEEVHILTAWRSFIVYILLLFIGINLRSVILAVPPVLPLIKHDLDLSYTATGLLTSMPILIMGATAWSSGLLVERIGGRNAVTFGLLLLAGGALLRALWPGAFPLFLFTVLLSLGIALTQTTVPVLVRRWFPAHIGLATALFTDGLIIGETLGAGATVPVMSGFLGSNAWVATFIFWGLPVVVLLVFWLWLAPAAPPQAFILPSSKETITEAGEVLPAPKTKTSVSTLHLGFLLGSGSLIYFAMNSWIANYNQAINHANLTPLALTILNAAQIPSSLLVTFFAQRMTGRRWPFVLAGSICFGAILGWIFTPASLEYLWAALLGASSALVFTLALALPALLAAPGKVARLTGATLSIGYGTAFVGPFIGGGLWDLFNLPALAFLPVFLASILLIFLGTFLPVYGARIPKAL
ncbi:MAG TPA: MFS transporter [Ktedonobacteraceae bacterium]|nr:MFS transporter [Ktedonobacteraceae bacterium]